MKKLIFLFFLCLAIAFSISGFFLASPSLALEPIIIEYTKHEYPNTTGDDQDYIPSDPNSVETVPVKMIVNISESFDPIVESPGTSSTPPTYQYRDITQIEQSVGSQELNTGFYRQNFFHFSRPVNDPLASPDSIKSSFTSYNSNHNATRRSLPAATQRCFISQQIAEISTFIDNGNSICIDREIDTPKGKIRVGEIILALIKSDLGTLYYPDSKCPPDQAAEEFPSSVLSALQSRNYSFSLSTAEYQQLYLYGIEPVCTNSLAQAVTHCNLTESGETRDCVNEIRSEPLAAATANENLYRSYLPESTKNVSQDYAKTKNTPAEIDKPNPLGWLAQFFKNFFSGRLSESKTYPGIHSVTTKIDTRQATGLQAHETVIKNFIPASQNNFDNSPASGTNGITLDPGESNAKLENVFFRLTRPASWK